MLPITKESVNVSLRKMMDNVTAKIISVDRYTTVEYAPSFSRARLKR